MKILTRSSNESLVHYAVKLASIYSKYHKLKERKNKGQFFTPEEVAIFMAGLINTVQINKSEVRILDPGAGTGILAASLCESIMRSSPKDYKKIIIDAYENDPDLFPLLNAVLTECSNELTKSGYDVEYNIYIQDFILHNARNDKVHPKYDVVISNPPYYKISKNSQYAVVMKDLIYGQPNIYALFTALATSLLKKGGQGVFIIPRSFCSGLYYKRFREWLLNNATIEHVHIFESRRRIFDHDGVLQENVILKLIRDEKMTKFKVNISVSTDKSFNDLHTFQVLSSHVIYRRNGELFIRIPTSPVDIKILNIVDSWPNTLRDIGLEISTGPVVPFRAKEYLRKKFRGLYEAPLLWPHNIQWPRVIWPWRKNSKEESIVVNENSKSILLPVANYVLVKRISSKEQKRRLHAGVFLRNEFKEFEYIGIENHVNYIYRPGGMLEESEAFGIAAILNTIIMDRYFRILNGNTQVNATDIRSVPFPSIDEIRKVGEVILEELPPVGYELDLLVGKVLGWDLELIKQLYGGP